MSETPPNAVDQLGKALEAAERRANELQVQFAKLKAVISRARRDLVARPRSTLAGLVRELRSWREVGAPVDLVELAASLDAHRHALDELVGRTFIRALQDGCASAGLEFRSLDTGWAVGPFGLGVTTERETATLRYAHQDVERELPLDVGRIVGRVTELAADLLTPPSDLKSLRSEVAEALRVAVARGEPATAGREQRASLPAVYREMVYVRQTRSKVPSKSTFQDYPRARFVVELATLLRSDENVRAARRFKPETAVLENAKDPRKSMFIPNDLAHGYGEGMYYQALVLLPPA